MAGPNTRRVRPRRGVVIQPQVQEEEVQEEEDEDFNMDEEEEEVEDHGVDYPFVEFEDDAQGEKFAKLAQRKMTSTRCVDRSILRTLKIDATLEDMFGEIGLRGLFNLQELSYRALTLEFLSSYVFNKRSQRVRFRLLNQTYTLTIDELSDLLDCDAHDDDDLVSIPDNKGPERYFPLFTGYTDVNASAMALSDVQHACIKLFLRYLGYLLYGRPDKSKVNSMEVLLCASYLNPYREPPFVFSPPFVIAKALHRMANQRATLECGAIVTRIARRLLNFEGRPPYVPITDWQPMVDDDFLRYKIKFLTILRGTDYRWLVRHDLYMPLPNDHLPPLASLTEVPPHERGDPMTYLIPDELLAPLPAADVVGGASGLRSHRRRAPVHLPSTFQPGSSSFPHGYHYDYQVAHDVRVHEGINQALVNRRMWEQMESLSLASGQAYAGARPSYYTGVGDDSHIFHLYGTTPDAFYASPYATQFGALARPFYTPIRPDLPVGGLDEPHGGTSQGRGRGRRSRRPSYGGGTDEAGPSHS